MLRVELFWFVETNFICQAFCINFMLQSTLYITLFLYLITYLYNINSVFLLHRTNQQIDNLLLLFKSVKRQGMNKVTLLLYSDRRKARFQIRNSKLKKLFWNKINYFNLKETLKQTSNQRKISEVSVLFELFFFS